MKATTATAFSNLSARSAAIGAAMRPAVARGKTRVYVVDDHALIRRGLATLIGDAADMTWCGEASDAAAALKGVIELQPDVAIVDIALPGNSGLELIKNIKAHSPNISILCLSMHSDLIYGLRALRAGAFGYVMKGDNSANLLDAIRRVRNGEICISQEVSNRMLQHVAHGDDPSQSSPVDAMTDREIEIMGLVGNGLSTREIAQRLRVSVKTVETHRSHLKEKLHLNTATELVRACTVWVVENKPGHETTTEFPTAAEVQSAI